MSKLKVAVQKSGRLSEKSLQLFRDCGIDINYGGRKLVAESSNFPMQVLFLRDDDIPHYVEQGTADIGILGLNEVEEKNKEIEVIRSLGFSRCRLALAIPREQSYNGIQDLQHKSIATSYPNILKSYLSKNGVEATIEEISGSVEIATGIGLADAICDLVSSGSTLLTNGLKEVEILLKSEAVMVKHKNLSKEKQAILDKIIFRLNAVTNASTNKYILLNAPNDRIEEIISLLPGMRSPSILPLSDSGWSSLHSVINEDEFWDKIDALKTCGAEGILVVPIEKMIV